MLGRKGMSPLIATVLLMAFAVALGGMIMNWSSGGGEEVKMDCSGVQLQSIKVCSDGTGVNMRVRNTGTEVIGALGMTVETGDPNPTLIVIPDSRVGKGESKDLRVTLPLPIGSKLNIYPSLGEGTTLAKCPDPVLTIMLEKC